MSINRQSMTEAEKERADREKIDRVNFLRQQYKEKHGTAAPPGAIIDELDNAEIVPEKKPLPAPTSPSLSDRQRQILAAVKKVANVGGVYDAADVLAELGWDNGPGNRQRISQAMSTIRSLEKTAREYRATSGRLAKPIARKPAPVAKASPVPVAAVVPDIAPVGEEGSRLAETLAELDRLLDGLEPTAFREAIAYMRIRFRL